MHPQLNICQIAKSPLGRKHTEETKKKISNIVANRIRSKEHCNNIRLAHLGKTFNWKKRKFSDECIKEIRTSKLSAYKIAKEYNCNIREIHNIIKRVTYKDIE